MSVRNAYRNTKVLVTGLTGFKGIWLGLWLKELGAEVYGLSLPPTAEMQTGWPKMEAIVPCRHGDIRDLNTVRSAFEDFQPEIVFHLAAQPLVRQSYRDPLETYHTNVMGTAHVLDAARVTPSVRATVVITTDKCYENKEWHWGYRESDPVGGFDPYSSSKACTEILCSSFRQSFADQSACKHLATARAGNVIGGGDWAEDRLVPDMVRAMLDREPILLRNPTALRPWQHVLEPLSGYILLGAELSQGHSNYAKAWNFGPSDQQPLMVRDIAHQFVDTWGRGEVVEERTQNGPHEAKFLKLDSSLAAAELGWSALLSPKERLKWTVDWYKDHQSNSHIIWETTEQQIRDMEQKIAQNPMLNKRWNRNEESDVLRPHSATLISTVENHQ